MPLFSRSYLKCITFLASFEALNIPITYELFCNSPKEGMIKGLWKNHSHESMVCTQSHRQWGLRLLRCSCVHSAACHHSEFWKTEPEKLLVPEQVYCSEGFLTFLSWQVSRQLGSPLTSLPESLRPEAIPPTQGNTYNPSPSPVCPHLDRLPCVGSIVSLLSSYWWECSLWGSWSPGREGYKANRQTVLGQMKQSGEEGESEMLWVHNGKKEKE